MTTLPVVLVPGLMCDSRVFQPQITVLSQRRSVQIAAPGRSGTLADFATEILAMAPPRFALVGHAMGGMIALEIMKQAPDRVARLALISTNFLPESPTMAAARDAQIAQVEAGQLKRVLTDELAPAYFAAGAKRAEMTRHVVDMGLALGGEVFKAQCLALRRRPDLSAVLETIRIPTLVMAGQQDALCPVSRHEVLAARIPNATLEIVPDAAHFPTLEAGQHTTAALQRWLTDALVLT